jgi:flagellar basal-body rod protein FlgB
MPLHGVGPASRCRETDRSCGRNPVQRGRLVPVHDRAGLRQDVKSRHAAPALHNGGASSCVPEDAPAGRIPVGANVSDAAITAALGRQMTRAVQRQAVAAGNLANLDTPGFRAKDLRFGDILSDEIGESGALVATNPRHLGVAGAGGREADTVDATGVAPRRDGNTVQLDRELLNMTRAAGDFSAAQTVLAAKFRLVRYAINEGR